MDGVWEVRIAMFTWRFQGQENLNENSAKRRMMRKPLKIAIFVREIRVQNVP
jgi:hypothetical protein